MKKILFIATHRKGRAPAQRFRFEQYIPYLESIGYICHLSNIITSFDDKHFYSKGISPIKLLIIIKAFFKRLNNILISNQYDIIFISREAFFTGTTFFERCFRKSKAKIVFDIDDAIWINTISDNNKFFAWMKNANKTNKIIALSDLVFAGNKFLADYCLKYNSKVVIIPTTINTDVYKPNYPTTMPLVIGWSGSFSTIEHFSFAIPALKIIKKKYGDQITFKVIGDSSYVNTELNIQGLAWSEFTELEELHKIHIGIMPLPDTEWTHGKCGLKGLQYMALEIPTVMSPIGVNQSIILDGINGFLASSTDEWVDKLSRLIEDKQLRSLLGRAGRKTVEQYYSVSSHQANYATNLEQLINN